MTYAVRMTIDVGCHHHVLTYVHCASVTVWDFFQIRLLLSDKLCAMSFWSHRMQCPQQ